MLILKTREEVVDFVQSIRSKGLTLGFVPTMGALHQGHITLIKKSIEENQYTLCSIFVNPTQFNNPDDLQKYPRTETEDIKKLEITGCDAVYFPSIDDIYPEGPESENIYLNGLDKVMEGTFRPGHFQGVATVVKRLFLQIQPTHAYFGEKDFQQLQIIRTLVDAEKLPVKIVGIPIVRETDGLAMSSRNMRLEPEFRNNAAIIYLSLKKAEELAENSSPNEIISKVEKIYSESKLELEYFIIAEEDTLLPAVNFEEGKSYRAFVSAYAKDVRLIDNLQLK
ncbi:pantoate--beta-alanine ligase [Apibacter sp. HY039]|uniref:pantoate--beta-alanine ligase n=1 Tax=Apibacter sp. HY039 TaxID=2501476 RepID=UPI000FEB9738|nr:pantoate--beta-alanine ligase [Apibacter sp. HY039]